MCKNHISKLIILELIIFAFSALNVNGQNDLLNSLNGTWTRGYIITPENDTVFGEVFDNLHINNRECLFREKESMAETLYSPDQIHSFKLYSGKYYISKTINNQNYFLEYLIKGVISIYQSNCKIVDQPDQFINKHYDWNSNQYFIEKNGDIFLLSNSERNLKDGFNEIKTGQKEYIGLLNFLLQDGNIKNKIEKVELDNVSLIELAIRYHYKICDDYSCIVYEKRYYDIFDLIFSFGWEEGYLIDKYNKKSHGYIQVKTDLKEKKIKFKNSYYQNVYKEFELTDIQSIHLKTGKVYSPFLIDSSGLILSEQMTIDTGFQLYYTDVFELDRFFVKKDNQTFELKNTSLKSFNSLGNVVYINKKEYVGMLSYILRDAIYLRNDINETKFNKDSILKLLNLYVTTKKDKQAIGKEF